MREHARCAMIGWSSDSIVGRMKSVTAPSIRAGDVVIAFYVALFTTYTFASGWFLITAVGRMGKPTHAALLFGPALAAYIGASVCVAAWLYRDVLVRQDGHDSPAWLLGFLLFGGITIPVYYFLRRATLTSRVGRLGAIEFSARAVVALMLAVTCVRLGWVLMIALGHLPITSAYRWVAFADRTLTWLGWLATVVVLFRHHWSIPRKVAWAFASLVGMFLIMPVLHFAYPQQIESPPSNST